ncbi:helix-turn-helix transcriptional regulator [Mesorhizobium sp. LHD-90]|uniref:helix-turn-helix domain-containing protein n=1 Tax=Mesorhizobium sp. LHD-90 TaxID=3071414 RepID=UPI0027DFC118|nr:helix-turn-helix transcriptional regulator [Mesorhizobium sp. LHD-90]MDQ6433762.1 helix-turn-helix transcriptional regulator [Mesorhizobium sp. LHD-90]
MSGLKKLRKRAWHHNGSPDLARRMGVTADRIQQFAIGHDKFTDEQLNEMAKFFGFGGYDAKADEVTPLRTSK